MASGAQSTQEAQQAAAAAQARRNSPAALAVREHSRTAFEHLGRARAAQVAREAFPGVINRPADGPPSLPAGARVARYIAANAAQLTLPGGKHAVVESTEPMAVETSPGHRAPVDLSLTKAGGIFESVRPVTGVLIPQRLSDGVQLLEPGVSLTPADAQGAPLNGSKGVVDGASVLYANTQTDMDTVVKPTTNGFEADTMLRSPASPGELYFRVGLPAGARLIPAHGATGPVSVVQDGRTIAQVTPPSAADAAGTTVPVSMGVKGDRLTLTVGDGTGDYQYPVEVDPEIRTEEDSTLGPSQCYKEGETERASSNWCVKSNIETKFGSKWESSGGVKQYNIGSNSAGEYTDVQYLTQGVSRIYKVEAEVGGAVEYGRAKLQLAHKVKRESGGEETGENEHEVVLAESKTAGERVHYGLNKTLCPKAASEPECPSSTGNGNENNLFWYRMEATEPTTESDDLEGTLYSAHVYVAQEGPPKTKLNTTEAHPKEDPSRENVAYGRGGWLSPTSGAFELIAEDPGIGVSRAGVVEKSGGGSFSLEVPIYNSGKCLGVQCKQTYRTPITYNPEMADGDDRFELWAEDETRLFGQVGFYETGEPEATTIKVDGTPPHNLEVSGWPTNPEISAAPHVLTIEATDGETGTPSSGVSSISTSVDGGPENPVPNASCPLGPCTASGKWTLAAEGLTEGMHRLLVTATDNAGNVAETEFTFDVRHGHPVSVGPGSVDPTTGQLTLSATDVSLAGSGGVSRAYHSRNLTAGAGGPLGPQWAIGLGGGEGLTVLPTGSVVLSSSAGATTTFTRNKKGELESPPGDGTVTIEPKEKEPGKGITEYLLKDTVAGTTTTFKQPAGTASTTPIYTNEFGAEGAQLSYPVNDATDSNGNIWVTDYANNRVEKFSAGGVLVGAYGSYGSEAGQFIHPAGIAINQSTGNVYVGDQGNSRVVELSSAGKFMEALGWGVKANGKAEYEICTTACKAGIAGSGSGQFGFLAGMAVDSTGNLWVIDYGNTRVEEFSGAGKVEGQFGSEGTGSGQLKNPLDIAASGGDLYISDTGNNRIAEFSTARAFVKAFGFGVSNGEEKLQVCTSSCQAGKAGSGSGQFSAPYGMASEPVTGNVYVVDPGNKRVEELSPAGAFIAEFGSPGTGAGKFEAPSAVAVSSAGGIYVGDSTNHLVQEWTRPSWLPTSSEGPSKNVTSAYEYKAVETEGKQVIEPTEALASTPAGVTCGKLGELKPEELKKGCRALTFKYDTEKTGATGEKASEWGTYLGHLEKVSLIANKPGTELMPETVVAEYAYDAKGRLRAEWDPRISPALKTTYGYDSEGHVTTVAPPLQEPWLLHYGATTTDSSTGRLLSVTRPAAASKTVLKEQDAMPVPVNTTAPTLSSTSPEIGVTVTAASEGKWSNSPLSYSYQWEDCHLNAKSEPECSTIPGAVNQSYTPQARDAGYDLVVQVTAENADGATAKLSAESKAVPMPVPTFSSISFGKAGSGAGELSEPVGIATDASGNVWVAENGNKRFSKFSSSGTFIATYGWGVSNGKEELQTCTSSCRAGLAGTGNGEFSSPYGIAVNQGTGDVYVSDFVNNRVQEFSSSGTFIATFGSTGTGNGQFEAPGGLDIDSSGDVWVADFSNGRLEEFSATGIFMRVVGTSGSGEGQLGHPAEIAFSSGNVYVTDYEYGRVDEFSASGTFIHRFGSEGAGAEQFEHPWGIATDPNSGDLYIADEGNYRVEEYNPAGALIATFGAKGTGSGQFSDPDGVAVSSTASIYVGDWTNDRIEEWTPHYSTTNPLPEPPATSSSAVTTLEYRVPVSGTGAPHEMSSAEVASWDQKDDPAEAMAVFPPVKPMGWPAKEYERATIEYMDEEGRTVNVASPSGGISTTEYNEANEVVRALSADNRALALSQRPISKELAAEYETKSTYNAKGQLAETLGPEHEVKVATGNGKGITAGSEVKARNHVVYTYDQGSPEGKTYDLVTKTVDSAETASKEEFDPRTTINNYSGEENLGWTLRKPTLVSTDATGLRLKSETVYEPVTGNVLETRSAKGSGSGSPVAPVYLSQFGSAGTAGGQFDFATADALDASGDLWVTDYGYSRVQEFSAAGTFIRALGWGVTNGKAEFEICTSGCEAGISGSGNGQLSKPKGIAVNRATGNVYVADYGNNRVEEFKSNGEFVRAFGKEGSKEGELNGPLGIAITPTGGEVWVGDRLNHRVDRFSETGVPNGYFGAVGTECKGEFNEPNGIAFSEGMAYIVDGGNECVEEFSMSGKYVANVGSTGSNNGQYESPCGIAVDAVSGNLYVGDSGNDRIEEFAPGGAFLDTFGKEGSGTGELSSPGGVAVNLAGEIYVADTDNKRIEEWEPVPSTSVYATQFGSYGTGNGKFNEPRATAIATSGNVYVLDTGNRRVEEFSASGGYLNQFGKEGVGNGEFKSPYGMAEDSKGNLWVADTGNNRVQEFNSKNEYHAQFGKEGAGVGQLKEPKSVAVTTSGYVFVVDGANNRIAKFKENGEFVLAFGYGVSNGKEEFEICTTTCQAGLTGSGNGEFNGPRGVAVSASGNVWVVDAFNNRVEEFKENGEYVAKFGSAGKGNGQFDEPKAITTDSVGNVWVTDTANNRIEEFSPSGSYLATFGDKGAGNGQFEEPWGTAITSSGSIYIADVKNNRVQEWAPASGPGNEGAHDTRTVYYSAGEESEVASCRKHPEWANLVCQTEPAAQTGVNSSPEQPVSTLTYNMWDEVETTTEKFGIVGTVTRTKTQTYDSAGRALTSEETSSPATDTALPKVTNEYNSETGALEKQKATIGGKVKTITAVDNTLGQLEKYTDAEGNTSSYVYNLDGQVEEVNDGQSEAKGVQTYAYEAKTGYLEKLVDSSAKTFTATHDVEGKMVTDNYPDGLTAKYTYNQVGTATGIEYKKEKDCATKCPETWFSDTDVPSVHGETLEQKSTLSKENYVYDNDGRLTETQETPTGKDCTSRLYAYDEEGDRTSQTTRESSTETCATEGGLLQAHSYDSADHLIDAGVKYEVFGNTLTLPEADAEGHTLTSTYYVDNQVASQTQNEKTNEYIYDSAGRTMEAKSEVKSTKVKSNAIPHYSGPGEALTWTSEEEGKKWSRNIPGIDGALDAIEKSGEETKPVLQLHDLQGNIVGTAALNEGETKLLSTYNSTEFGVPSEGKAPPPYAWLGAGELATELSSGVSTEGGASYVPQIARSLQTSPVVPPGAFPNGAGTGSQYTAVIPGWSTALANAESATTIAEYTAKQEEERRKKEAEAAATAARIAAERAEMEAEYPNQGGVEEGEGEEEGLIVTNQYGQPESGGGGPVARASGKRKNRLKYNACEGRYNPKDQAEACCYANGSVRGRRRGQDTQRPPGGRGEPCDVEGSEETPGRGNPSQPERHGQTESCQSGTEPGVGAFTGAAECKSEGDSTENENLE
jgi:YD repeat-containing protein